MRASCVLAVGFLGSLLALVLVESEGLLALCDLVVIASSWWLLGSRRRSEGLLAIGTARSWGLACVVAAGAFAVSAGYAELLARFLGDGEPAAPDAAGFPARILWSALAPGVLEELLLRGVLFRAACSLASERGAIGITAVLFAFLHGLNGGWLIEIPHRLVFGVLVGWLRLRAGSVWPCVFAHVLHNTGAVLLESA